MPDPDRLLKTLAQAVRAFQNTPGRRGRVIVLQNAREVLAAGDLHGNVENFRMLLDRAELGKNPERHLVLQELIHGPHRYPVGGDKSHQLVDLLAALKCQYPRQVHMLLGNHELSQSTGQEIAKTESELNALFREGVGTAYMGRAAEIYAAYLKLLAAVPLAIRTANRILLTHSIPTATRQATFDPAVLEREVPTEADVKPGGSIHSLVWGRDVRPPTVASFLQLMHADLAITGHIPCEEGYQAPNDRQIILDSMGSPACYCLFSTERTLSQKELLACIGTL